MNERKAWVSRSEPLPLTRQCELTGVARSTVYAPELVPDTCVRKYSLTLVSCVFLPRLKRLLLVVSNKSAAI